MLFVVEPLLRCSAGVVRLRLIPSSILFAPDYIAILLDFEGLFATWCDLGTAAWVSGQPIFDILCLGKQILMFWNTTFQYDFLYIIFKWRFRMSWLLTTLPSKKFARDNSMHGGVIETWCLLLDICFDIAPSKHNIVAGVMRLGCGWFFSLCPRLTIQQVRKRPWSLQEDSLQRDELWFLHCEQKRFGRDDLNRVNNISCITLTSWDHGFPPSPQSFIFNHKSMNTLGFCSLYYRSSITPPPTGGGQEKLRTLFW